MVAIWMRSGPVSIIFEFASNINFDDEEPEGAGDKRLNPAEIFVLMPK